MIRTILTGVDANPTAATAALRAAQLASSVGAQLIVLSAYRKFEVEKFTSGHEEIVFTTEKDARQTAERITADLRREFPDVAIKAEPAEGKPADALVRAAERLDADLIVVGNKRVQGVARVLGSVARDVAAHASCDVYVVHTHRR